MENMYFKENVRFLRKLKGVSQNEFADDLGYKSFTTVQKWEDGTSYPSLPVVSQIAEYFGVSLEMLVYSDLSSILSHYRQVPVVGTVRTGPGILASRQCRGGRKGRPAPDHSVRLYNKPSRLRYRSVRG